jgi:DNA polymerase III psi subunit
MQVFSLEIMKTEVRKVLIMMQNHPARFWIVRAMTDWPYRPISDDNDECQRSSRFADFDADTRFRLSCWTRQGAASNGLRCRGD